MITVNPIRTVCQWAREKRTGTIGATKYGDKI